MKFESSMTEAAKYLFPVILFFVLPQWVRGFYSDLAPFLTSLLFLYFLFIDNPNKKYLKEFAIAIAILPVIDGLIAIGSLQKSYGVIIIYILSATSFTFYFLRFWLKPNKWSFYELIKPLAVLQFVICYSADILIHPLISAYILGYIYFVTRMFQPQNISNMKRNLFIVLMMLVTVFSLVFSRLQKGYAEDNLVESQIQINEKLKLKAELELRINILEEKLSDCQSGD